MTFSIRRIAFATCLLAASAATQAQEVYGGVNLYGASIGYAHALNDRVTLRGDLNGGFSYSRNDKHNGVEYDGKLKAQYLGLYADWFPASNGFRLTGGLTVNDNKLTLDSRAGANANATINNKPVAFAGNDYLNARAKFSSVSPYLGIGWGHKQSTQKGWGFYADLGVMFGKFTIDQVNQNLTTNHANEIQQKDVDAEVAKAQDSLNKLKVLPVIGIGAAYRF